jgi:hypothetical protein
MGRHENNVWHFNPRGVNSTSSSDYFSNSQDVVSAIFVPLIANFE